MEGILGLRANFNKIDIGNPASNGGVFFFTYICITQNNHYGKSN